MFAINERSIRSAICRKSFYEFFKMVWPIIVGDELKKNWHIPFLCMHLQRVAELVFAGKPKEYDLVINVPPGSSKSTIISQAFPAWCWTRMPSMRTINASHGLHLSHRDSLRTRDIVESEFFKEHFGTIELRDDENMKGRFTNTEMGARMATSVCSKITGFHGHILIVDDPLDPEEAISEADMKKVNRWMTNTLPSRGIARADTPMIICQQRLAQNDPSGERLAVGGRVKHICIPAELLYDKNGRLLVNVQPPEIIRYYKNNLLDPSRLDKQNLLDFEKRLGAYGYAGQYLQDPVPLSGAMFDTTMLRLHEGPPPPMVRLIRGWDKAATKDAGCFSAGVLFGIDRHGDFWVLDVARGQWSPTVREQMIRNTAKLDRSGAHGTLYGRKASQTHVEIVIEKEGGSGGKESSDNSIKNLVGFQVMGKSVTGKKEERAWYYASQVGLKDRVTVVTREWTKAYIEELRFFPHGKYKDQVDASSLAFNRLSRPRTKRGAGVI